MKRVLFLSVLLILGAAQSVFASTPETNEAESINVYTVVSTLDFGASGSTSDGVCASNASGNPCTLRAAIQEANGTSGLDIINFDLLGVGPYTFFFTSALPSITGQTYINGTSQGGSICPSQLAPADLQIVLDGTGVTGDGLRLTESADNSLIYGLVIINFSSDGIELDGTDNTQIFCNHIGIEEDGTTAAGNTYGIRLDSGTFDNIIGGTTDDERNQRNVISGNSGRGIYLDPQAQRTIITGNYIGTNAFGLSAVGNDIGIRDDGGNTEIGGEDAHQRNVISGNRNGIEVGTNGDNGHYLNNYIGPNALGGSGIGNTHNGIWLFESAGANVGNENIEIGTASAPNKIAYNTRDGIMMTYAAGDPATTDGVTIRYNSIHDNGQRGIDLDNDGVTPNDAFDGDAGSNELQNYPTFSSATDSTTIGNPSQITLIGNLASTASQTFTVDFYHNPTCDSSGYGEGRTYIASTSVFVGAAGSGSFNQTYVVDVPIGSFITATATDSDGNTSEFSQCEELTASNAFEVNNNGDADDGNCNGAHCTLREAINAVNAVGGGNVPIITFAVSDVKVASDLPTITNQVIIDGLSFGGSCPNGDTPAAGLIDISSVGGAANGLVFGAGSDSSVLQGVAITKFPQDGLQIVGANHLTIQCNHFGLFSDGSPSGNSRYGIYNSGGKSNLIGGEQDTQRNVVSANGVDGIHFTGASDNRINGNFIGLGIDGATPMGNGEDGIQLVDSSSNVIGEEDDAANVISSNDRRGIILSGSSASNTIISNIIGLASDGQIARGNDDHGIVLFGGDVKNNEIGPFSNFAGLGNNVISDNMLSGVYIADGANGNVIQHNFFGTTRGGWTLFDLGNGEDGVRIAGSLSEMNEIVGNKIYHSGDSGVSIADSADGNRISATEIGDSGGLGIDLDNNNAVNENDTNDPDGGANGGQNFPELLLAVTDGTVVGTINSVAATTYTLEFFRNYVSCDPSGNGEASNYMGSHTVVLGAGVNDFQFTAALDMELQEGNLISATATNETTNDTSEFSDCIPVTKGMVVNDTGDENDGFGDDVCNVGTGSDRACTLRQAIVNANGLGEPTMPIYIAIEGDQFDFHSIQPQTGLPNVADTVMIDAVTYQSWADCDFGLRVSLDGALLGGIENGLRFITGSENSSVQGLAIGNFPWAGIRTQADGLTVTCNHLGISANGAADFGNGTAGVYISADNITIDNNVISGNDGDGIDINGSSINPNTNIDITSNTIGVNMLGTAAIRNDGSGIDCNYGDDVQIEANTVSENSNHGIEAENCTDMFIFNNNIGANFSGNGTNFGNLQDGINLVDSTNVAILGFLSTTGNFIIRNSGDGIYAENVTNLAVVGNHIGSRQDGTDGGNGDHGIHLVNTSGAMIGGQYDVQFIDQNVIFGNGGDGIYVASGTGNALWDNRIWGNDELGIDLGNDGVDSIDPGDTDSGANTLLNYPVISSADDNGNISGTVFSANGTYTVYFYRNDVCDPLTYGEGMELVGSTTVTVSSGNQQAFTTNVGTSDLSVGDEVTAVTVDNNDNTSEFARCETVVAGAPTSVVVSGQRSAMSQSDRFAHSYQPLGLMLVIFLGLLFLTKLAIGRPI